MRSLGSLGSSGHLLASMRSLGSLGSSGHLLASMRSLGSSGHQKISSARPSRLALWRTLRPTLCSPPSPMWRARAPCQVRAKGVRACKCAQHDANRAGALVAWRALKKMLMHPSHFQTKQNQASISQSVSQFSQSVQSVSQSVSQSVQSVSQSVQSVQSVSESVSQ